MALERECTDSEIQRLEAELERDYALENFETALDNGAVPATYRLAAEQIGLQTPGSSSINGQGDISLHMVESLRMGQERARSGRGPNLLDWRKQPRPKSASYMRPRCRITPEGGGGAPLARPSSAPAGRPPPKTERWRESGLTRWPKESDKTNHPADPSDGDPLRRGEPKQPNWTGELWIRSLRRPGVEIQDPTYHDVAQRGMRELHEEWQTPRPSPARPHSARAGYSRRTPVPYSGSTAIGKAALPRKHDMKKWVERPVATGTMALKHFDGQRYKFSQEPRSLEWEEYLKFVNTTSA